MNARRSGIVSVVAVIVAVVGGAWLAASASTGLGFRGWLTEVADPADADRGWDRLEPWLQEQAYGGDRAAYLADVADAEWHRLQLAPAVEVWRDDGFVRMRAELRSAPETVPPFLLERRIVHGECDAGGRPIGIGVYEDRRPFSGGRFSGGGLTGGGVRCNAAFTDG